MGPCHNCSLPHSLLRRPFGLLRSLVTVAPRPTRNNLLTRTSHSRVRSFTTQLHAEPTGAGSMVRLITKHKTMPSQPRWSDISIRLTNPVGCHAHSILGVVTSLALLARVLFHIACFPTRPSRVVGVRAPLRSPGQLSTSCWTSVCVLSRRGYAAPSCSSWNSEQSSLAPYGTR